MTREHARRRSPGRVTRRDGPAQSTSGTSCVLTSAATISGTVAARAYQMVPPTRKMPAAMSSAFALQRAICVPAAARDLSRNGMPRPFAVAAEPCATVLIDRGPFSLARRDHDDRAPKPGAAVRARCFRAPRAAG